MERLIIIAIIAFVFLVTILCAMAPGRTPLETAQMEYANCAYNARTGFGDRVAGMKACQEVFKEQAELIKGMK